jgi:Cft2 family RNA processing exonuclease
MRVEYTADGIHVPEAGLWLDSRRPVPVNWISHAHSDHARGGHNMSYSSAETIRFLHLRDEEARNDPAASQVLTDREWFSLSPSVRIQPLPCSHIVGARQLLLEYGGERLVYTGDIKLRSSLLGSSTEIAECDHLIIESTFGLPIFRFLDAEEAARRIIAFAKKCLFRKELPVFLGYGLGRGQEIVHVLSNAGIPVAVHGAIARLIPAHEESGYQFPGWQPYDPKLLDGKALVVVPGFRDVLETWSRPFRIAYVSGWALLDHSRASTGADELIPYSDHADFLELLQLVERSKATRVDIVHGYTEAFAQILRQRGLDARGIKASSPDEVHG